tara:strand:- start:558 stop:1388 length:831 start_codon:yes stop_codon:yes gene_type:complete
LNNYSKIGVFDSGVGGLTVLKSLLKLLPNESYLYLGDSANLPYGNKSIDIIEKRSLQICKYFIKEKKVSCLVIACNTASAVFFNTLEKKLKKKKWYNKVPIFGVINPVVNHIKNNQYKKIAIIGTKRTVASKSYKKVINRFNSNIEVMQTACPLFVPMIEEGLINKKLMMDIIDLYLRPFKSQNIDAIILGCTHYPIIANQINKYFKNKIEIIDTGKSVAEEVHLFVKKHHINQSKKQPTIKILSTDITTNFHDMTRRILNIDNINVNKIDFNGSV